MRVEADPNDPRTDEIVDDVVTNGPVNAMWGLHVIDMALTMGNLLDLVGQQARAFRAPGGDE